MSPVEAVFLFTVRSWPTELLPTSILPAVLFETFSPV
jgi:hypothetical protein